MPAPLRILDLRDSPWYDGPGRTVLEIAKGLDRSRFHIVVGSFVSGELEGHAYLCEARRRGLSILPVRERRGFDPNVTMQIKDFCNRTGIHVIHTHEWRSNLYGLWVARTLGLKTIATAHGWIANDLRGKVYTRLDRSMLRLFDEVVAVSKMIERQLRASWVPSHKITVVENTLQTGLYHADRKDKSVRDSLGIPPDRCLIGKIGRLSREKAQVCLFHALRRLLDRGDNPHLVLVGHGPDEVMLRNLAVELGIAGRVTFAGFRTDMRGIYNSLDIVAQSSLTEGMPNVILEAMAMLVPVVATDAGGTGELIEPGKHGWLVTAGDADALADALHEAIIHPKITSRLADAARERVVSTFDSRIRLERMAVLYERVSKRIEGRV